MARPVIVIECEPEAFEYLRDLVHARLREAWEEGTLEGQPWRIHLAADEPAEMVLDVFKEPKAGAGRHVLNLRASEMPHGAAVHPREYFWTMEHSLMCRMAGLENCPLTELVKVAVDESHLDEVGRYLLSVEGGVLTWEEL